MKFVRQLVALCALFGAMGSGALAANGPDQYKDEVAKDLIFKGDAKCTTCHDVKDAPGLLAIGKRKHGTTADTRTPTCVKCHGESEDHVKNVKDEKIRPLVERNFNKDTKTPVEARNETCLSCHEKDARRSHWAGSAHESRGLACGSCHQIHTVKDKALNKKTQTEVCFTCHKEQRAQANRPSHHPVKEGKVACSDCHNPHGSAGPSSLVKDSVNETCFECHMEKRGPFLHEHQPVTENCSICHNPHGTTNPTLLKQRQPLLCQNCHNVASGSSHRGAFAQQAAGRSTSDAVIGAMASGCLNCHNNIHGGNSTTSNSTGGRFRR